MLCYVLLCAAVLSYVLGAYEDGQHGQGLGRVQLDGERPLEQHVVHLA